MRPLRLGAVVAIALGLALALLPLACRRSSESGGGGAEVEEDRPIARVDGEEVPKGLFDAYLRDSINLADESHPSEAAAKASGGESAAGQPLADDVKSRLLDRFLLERALVKKAHQAKLQVTREEVDQFTRKLGLGPLDKLHEDAPLAERQYLERYLQDSLLIKRYLDSQVLAQVAASDEETRTYYDHHASQFSHPDRYRLRLIRVDSLQEAQELQRQIGRDGSNFLRVAQSMSEGVEGEQGKDLGEWAADRLPERFADAVAGLKKGEVSGIVQDPDGGYNLIYLEDKKEGGTVPFDQVRDKLRGRVAREKKDRALGDAMEGVRKATRTEMIEDNLGFRYVPPGAGEASPAPASSPESPPHVSPEGAPPADSASPPAPASSPHQGGTR